MITRNEYHIWHLLTQDTSSDGKTKFTSTRPARTRSQTQINTPNTDLLDIKTNDCTINFFIHPLQLGSRILAAKLPFKSHFCRPSMPCVYQYINSDRSRLFSMQIVHIDWQIKYSWSVCLLVFICLFVCLSLCQYMYAPGLITNLWGVPCSEVYALPTKTLFTLPTYSECPCSDSITPLQ